MENGELMLPDTIVVVNSVIVNAVDRVLPSSVLQIPFYKLTAPNTAQPNLTHKTLNAAPIKGPRVQCTPDGAHAPPCQPPPCSPHLGEEHVWHAVAP
ncbi:hypothetical protein H920_01088 [Fukomys damarensis]|uniref:Uncharacterized protein n=1 Tax=Fukomys damarensis TaxID=885580 RepID=A0A091DZD3_FUKDA|nr:hypothetical protein H920_01088 [Fukomys damarensis]